VPVYVVEEGEHISGIAEKFGFRDFRTVWNDPHNAKLRAKRKNPHVLLPGDELFIPEKEIRTENRPTAKLHAFQIPSGKLKLKVLIQNVDGDPIDDTTVSLLAGGEASRVKTQQGIVEKEIPRNAHDGKIELEDDQIPMGIGDLDPVDSESGQLQRLMNLGYYRKPISPIDQDEWRSGVEEFQCDHDLNPPTGVVDGQTQDKLEEAHGC